MSALTEEQLKAEKQCHEAVKAMNNGQRAMIIAHLANLQLVELERLLEQTDIVRIHRAQGAAKAIQSVIDLISGQS